jgi:hypothetical protein
VLPDGLAWTGHTGDDEVDPALYSGGAGIVITLLEGPGGERRYAVTRPGHPQVTIGPPGAHGAMT